MVDNLRQDDSNAQIATLMDQLGKARRSVGTLAIPQTPLPRASNDQRQIRVASLCWASTTTVAVAIAIAINIKRTNSPNHDSKSSIRTKQLYGTGTPHQPPSPARPLHLRRLELRRDNRALPYHNGLRQLDPPTRGNGFIPIQPLLPNLPQHLRRTTSYPQASVLCHCSSPTSCASGYHDVKPNIWRAINEVLVKPTKLSAEEMAIEEYNAEDIPVRAMIEGWDSIERAGKMTPTWRKLRRADELCFTNCANTERLAAMRICHLLITYHGDPSMERRATLPRWYLNRPGLRERLIFSQHQYCNNSFWELLQTNLKIVWTDGFQDTFYHNAHTGKYHISPLFEQRIRDINAWTMSTDFFQHFPELSEDIPAYMGIPASMGGVHPSAVVPSSRRRYEDDESKVHKGQRAAIC
ncbi:hypothetical protein ACKAV7_013312 [Fusarium commune]